MKRIVNKKRIFKRELRQLKRSKNSFIEQDSRAAHGNRSGDHVTGAPVIERK
jgi:hypothetical protein